MIAYSNQQSELFEIDPPVPPRIERERIAEEIQSHWTDEERRERAGVAVHFMQLAATFFDSGEIE